MHSPTLRTIKMVEETIKNLPDSATKVSELKRALPRQVNHNTLMEILDYLVEDSKIVIGTKGITYTYNPKLSKIINDLREKRKGSEKIL